MLMPAPTLAARPTRKASALWCVAIAAANSGPSVQAERPGQPDRLPLHETLHVAAANQRNVLAEFLPIKLDEPMAMAILLGPHLNELIGQLGKIGPQAIGKIGVNAGVFFFQCDRQ